MNTARLMKYKALTYKNMRNPSYTTDFNVEDHIRRFDALPVEVQVVKLRAQLRSRFSSRKISLNERLRIYKSMKEISAFFGVGA